MTDAADLLDRASKDLAHGSQENRLVPLITSGEAPVALLGAFAAEQQRIIVSDWRSFLSLAAKGRTLAEREFFTSLAAGEAAVLPKVKAFAAGCGLDQATLDDYQPLAGCQAYPAYIAWLALNAEPTDVVLALMVNFAVWGSYCGIVAEALREHYGFADSACEFFDYFAQPAPELEQQARSVLQSGLDSGRHTPSAFEYGRLLQRYELMFWNTLADRATASDVSAGRGRG